MPTRRSAHYIDGQSLFIHSPDPKLSTAENILHLLRPDSKYSPLEAKDTRPVALVLHAEHGGGNNSTFTTHVVTSSGTDTYSTVAASLASLKGPKHGGANIKVVRMFEDMKRELDGDTSDEKIADYLTRLLDKQAFDRAGLIYGMGHAVYSLSDPRADILKSFVCQLAEEKGRMDELQAVLESRGARAEDHRREAQDLQGRRGERRLLQRVCIQHAGAAHRALHADIRDCAHRRLERPPDGGAHERRAR
jgi:citrate synthase